MKAWWLAPATALGSLALWTAARAMLQGAVPGAEVQAEAGYAPVAPASALAAALHSNLKIVQDWLAEQDFVSAAETGEQVLVLARVYQFHGSQAAWREQTKALEQQCSRLIAAAKAKDRVACEQSLEACAKLLSELRTVTPGDAERSATGFRPPGSTRIWMRLLDGTYTDAKSAKTASELANLAYTLAEGSNVTQHLRPDSQWRESALEVREFALRVAALAESGAFETARSELRGIYNRCEACHRGYKRK